MPQQPPPPSPSQPPPLLLAAATVAVDVAEVAALLASTPLLPLLFAATAVTFDVDDAATPLAATSFPLVPPPLLLNVLCRVERVYDAATTSSPAAAVDVA